MKDEYVRKAHRFSLRWDLGRAGGPAFTRTGVNLSRLRGEGVDMGGDADGVDIASLTPMRAALRVGRAFGASRLLDSAPPRCAMVLYDTAVGMSASCAEALARQALGLPSGAAWNAALRSALRRCDDRRTALAMCHLRRARYCALAARSGTRGRPGGRDRRLLECRTVIASGERDGAVPAEGKADGAGRRCAACRGFLLT